MLPLLQQTILLWQVSLGYLVLGKKLTPAEVRPATFCCFVWHNYEHRGPAAGAPAGLRRAAREP